MTDDIVWKHTGRQTDDDVDGLEFTMSDGSIDRAGDVIDPAGWKVGRHIPALYGHDGHRLPIGKWTNVKVVKGQLTGKLQLAEEGTSAFTDAVRKLLRQKMIDSCSVGFRPLEKEPLSDQSDPFFGPFKFTKQELLECSLVAVPANPNATIRRALDQIPLDIRRQLVAVSGETVLKSGSTTFAAVSGLTPSRDKTKMSITERIQQVQDEIIAMRDLQAPLIIKVKDGGDLDDEEQDEFDRLEVDRGKLEKKLGTLQATERSLGLQAVTRSGAPLAQTVAVHSPAAAASGRMAQRPGSRPLDLLVRLAVCHLKATAERKPLDMVRSEIYRDHQDVEAVIKTATNPAQTTVAGWAAELVDTAILDFMEAIRPISAYGSLSSLGMRFSFGDNGTVKIPRRNNINNAAGDLRGAFVGEGQPIPVRRGSFGSLSLTPHKMGVISTFTREQAQRSTPAIEGLIREGIIEDTAEGIDQALLDAVAGDTIRPAGLGNGVTPGTGTAGGGTAAVTADIAAILAPFVAANAADRLAWVMNPILVHKLGWMASAIGVYPFREQVQGGTFSNYPIIQTTNAGATDLWLVRYADFMSATSDTPEFDVSDVATIHEDDGAYPADQAMRVGTTTVLPIVGKATPPPALADIATPVRSLWQTASIGIRMLLGMDWGMRRSGMVQKTTGLTW